MIGVPSSFLIQGRIGPQQTNRFCSRLIIGGLFLWTASPGTQLKNLFWTRVTYYVLGGGIGRWDYGTTGWSGFADTSQALRHAFAKNPYMRVFIAEGLYDAATPYFAVDYTFDHMGLNAEAHKNISRDRFTAGHMVYIDEASMSKLKRDVNVLYDPTALKQ